MKFISFSPIQLKNQLPEAKENKIFFLIIINGYHSNYDKMYLMPSYSLREILFN